MVFLETTRPIELKFHMMTPYDWLAKIYTNVSGHMTPCPYMVKTLQISSTLETKDHGLGTWYVALEMWALQGLHK